MKTQEEIRKYLDEKIAEKGTSNWAKRPIYSSVHKIRITPTIKGR